MKQNSKTIWFDMDGTICDLYRDPDWLDRILSEDVSLYTEAKLMINSKEFSSLVNLLQKNGYNVGIISYLPWKTSKRYQLEVKKAKEDYIKTKFPKIKFDKIHIIPYTIPKETFANEKDCLIDDDIKNRKAWTKGKAYTHENIIKKIAKIYHIEV